MDCPSPRLRRRPRSHRPTAVPALIESLEGRQLLATGTSPVQVLIDQSAVGTFPLRTVTVTVHPVFANAGPLTGQVTASFQVNNDTAVGLGTQTVDANGIATFVTPTPLPNGSFTTFSASYSGDPIHAPQHSSFVLVIPGVITTTTLSSTPNPSTPGQPVTFTAVVAAPISNVFGRSTDTVTFTVDGQAQPPVPITVTDGLGQATFTTSALAAGSHVVTASYSGSDPFGASTSAPFTQVVQAAVPATPPTVLGLRRFGIHRQPTSLVLTFDRALDPVTAQDVANYQIFDGRGRAVVVTRAVYDPEAQAVTLSPSHRLDIHRTYVLTVTGTPPTGVRGADLTPLDGSGTGQPGSNYQALIDRSILVLPTRAIRHASVHPTARLASRFHAASARGAKTA